MAGGIDLDELISELDGSETNIRFARIVLIGEWRSGKAARRTVITFSRRLGSVIRESIFNV